MPDSNSAPDSSPAPEGNSKSDSKPESEELTYDPTPRDRVTYDSVTIHYRAEGEEPLTVERVIRFAESIFPGSRERALQIIDDPRKGPPESLFDVKLILVPPEAISHIGLLVVSVQKWALSATKALIKKATRQCSREMAFLKRRRAGSNLPKRTS